MCNKSEGYFICQNWKKWFNFAIDIVTYATHLYQYRLYYGYTYVYWQSTYSSTAIQSDVRTLVPKIWLRCHFSSPVQLKQDDHGVLQIHHLCLDSHTSESKLCSGRWLVLLQEWQSAGEIPFSTALVGRGYPAVHSYHLQHTRHSWNNKILLTKVDTSIVPFPLSCRGSLRQVKRTVFYRTVLWYSKQHVATSNEPTKCEISRQLERSTKLLCTLEGNARQPS